MFNILLILNGGISQVQAAWVNWILEKNVSCSLFHGLHTLTSTDFKKHGLFKFATG